MAEEVIEQTATETAPEIQATEQGGETGGQGQAQPDFTKITQQMEAMQKELGQYRKLQSMNDRLPSLIDKRLTEWQKAQQLNQLPPEERQQREQFEQQEKALAEFSKKQALEAFKEAAKDYLPVIESWKKTQEQQAFFSEFRELAGEQAEELEEAGKSVFAQISKDLDSGDEFKIEAAIKFMEKAEKGGPEFVLFHAQRELARTQKANADGVVQNRVQSGKVASQRPNGKGAAQQGSRKPLNLMSEAEREALIEKVGSEKYGEMLKADMAAAGIKG